MSFVRLENLNDFIQPSTTCIKPVEKKTPGLVAKVSDINLSDCLACSGCITSAESVLVQQQNYEGLFKVINDNKVSKSVASLANKYGFTAQETAERLASFFVSLGCNRVYDINLARHLALVESYREFKERRRSGSKLPIISSICPGWICYAEKTNGDLVIPYLSKVRSPQQIMGSLLKKIYSKKYSVKHCDIFHVTLMPCFDKKLEASRDDFKDSDGTQDVDCVLTPVELDEIFKSEGVTLEDFNPRPLDCLQETGFDFDIPLTSHLGSVSGGYAENLLVAEAVEFLGLKDLKSTDLEYSTTNNGDFIEVRIKKTCVESGGDNTSSTTLAKYAIVNGFRNIQTVVQRLKRKALKYDYIEIMACPSGCINGGAQCRPSDGSDPGSTIDGAKSIYKSVRTTKLDISHRDNHDLYAKLDLQPAGLDSSLYTSFHSVPKIQNLAVNW